MPAPTVRITVALPVEVSEALDRLAADTGKSKTQCVVDAIRDAAKSTKKSAK